MPAVRAGLRYAHVVPHRAPAKTGFTSSSVPCRHLSFELSPYGRFPRHSFFLLTRLTCAAFTAAARYSPSRVYRRCPADDYRRLGVMDDDSECGLLISR